jgi:hypothetical protein
LQSALDKTEKFPLSEGIFRGSRDLLRKIAFTDTAQKLTIVAIAIRLYQMDHAGDLPKRLDELVPAYLPVVPPDIMDGAPLHYERREDHFLLYGIGFDGIDDGGNAEPPNGQRYRTFSDGRDIVWPRAAATTSDAPSP